MLILEQGQCTGFKHKGAPGQCCGWIYLADLCIEICHKSSKFRLQLKGNPDGLLATFACNSSPLYPLRVKGAPALS